MNISLSEWQSIVGLATASLGVMATLFTAFGTSARRLRRDLQADTGLLEHIEGDAKTDLAALVTRRTHLLVAATRYPSLTWYECSLILLLGLILWQLLASPESLRDLAAQGERPLELSGLGQGLFMGVALVIYAAIVRSWAGRAGARVVYIYSRLGDDDVRNLARLLAFPSWIAPAIFVGAMGVASLLNLMAIADVYHWGIEVPVLVTTAITMLVAWFVMVVARKERLFDYLRFYTDPLHMGADVPKLRPQELGRTDEDLARWKAKAKPKRLRRSTRNPDGQNSGSAQAGSGSE